MLVVCILSPNVGKLGVGPVQAGVCNGFLPWLEKAENVVLKGVPTDASEPSGLETESALFLKLMDDLFFLRGPDRRAGAGVPGDGEMAAVAGLVDGRGEPDSGM